jgi:succinate dehydrogenase / fumarate reductase cytochrome b subunit
MNRIAHWYLSSIGAKLLMAATGVLLFGFVIGHLLGNLLMFAGPDAMNSYAQFLKEKGLLLWGARSVILVVFVAHIASAFRVWRQNRAARPEPYDVSRFLVTTYAARTIMISGILVLAFVIYHLMHFTLGVTDPAGFQLVDSQGRHNVHAMVIRGFSSVPIAAMYLVAVLILGMHLSHGVTSLFQTIGLHGAKFSRFTSKLGPLCGILIFVGYASIPLAVMAGILK